MKSSKVKFDDLTKGSDDQLIANYENITKEIEQYKQFLEHHSWLLEANKKRLGLFETLHKISEEKNAMREPQFEFQGDEEWLKAQRELLRINNESERRNIEKEIKALEERVAGSKLELERFAAILPDLKAELDKRGVEYD
jgi:vancomycin resistance protein YoaR